MAARKGFRALILHRLLTVGPMTGREIEKMYIDLGGAVNERGRVSFDTLRHLINGLPVKASKQSGTKQSALLDPTYSIDPREYQKQEEERGRPKRSREILNSLLEKAGN